MDGEAIRFRARALALLHSGYAGLAIGISILRVRRRHTGQKQKQREGCEGTTHPVEALQDGQGCKDKLKQSERHKTSLMRF